MNAYLCDHCNVVSTHGDGWIKLDGAEGTIYRARLDQKPIPATFCSVPCARAALHESADRAQAGRNARTYPFNHESVTE